jgi:hypothetical protein
MAMTQSPDPIRCAAVFEAEDPAARDALEAQWLRADPLATLAERTAGRYLRSRPLPSDEPAFKLRRAFGLSQFWVDGLETAAALCADLAQAPQALGDDLLRQTRLTVLATRDMVIIDGPDQKGGEDGVKAYYFSGRKPGMSTAAFQDHWLNVHGPLVVPSPGISRYVQCHPCPELYATAEPRFDAQAIFVFPSRAEQARFFASENSTVHQRGDLPNLFDMTGRALRFYVEDLS